MEARSRAKNSRKTRQFAFIAICVALVALLAGWALGATLVGGKATAAPREEEGIWVEAAETSIGSSLNLSTTVKQPVRAISSNQLAGVVSEATPGIRKEGDVLYSVSGTEVYAVEGSTPFYQDINSKASGKNVEQVEKFLKNLGFFEGEPNSTFNSLTASGIKRWQKETHQKVDGTIPLGRIVAIESLPGQIELGEEIALGQQVGGGEAAVLAATGARTFTLSITAAQAALIPQDSVVQVEHDKFTWDAVIAQTTTDESNNVVHTLAGKDGGDVCAKDCDKLPAGSTVTLRSKVVVVPDTTGVGIPAAAVTTTPDGKIEVLTETGPAEVTIKASVQGMVITEGLKAQTKVQVPQASNESP